MKNPRVLWAVLPIVILMAIFSALFLSMEKPWALDGGALTLALTQEDAAASEIPDYVGVRQTYSFRLPDGTEGDYLNVWLVHQYATISYDGERVYQITEPSGSHLGKTRGCFWVSIPVPDGIREITLTVTPVYRDIIRHVPRVVFGTQLELSHLLFGEEGIELIGSLCCMLSGLLVLLFSYLIKELFQDRRATLLLGAATFFFGLWRFSDLPFIVMELNDAALLLTYLSIFSQMLFIPLIFFYFYMLEKRDVFYLVPAMLMLVLDGVTLILQLCDVCDLRAFWAYDILLVIIFTVLAFFRFLSRLLKPEKDASSEPDTPPVCFFCCSAAAWRTSWSIFSGEIPCISFS